MPRQQWRLGRILNLIIGRDARIRAVKLLVSKTRAIIERPINLIFPLECEVIKNDSTMKNAIRVRRNAAVAGELKRKLAK